MDVQILIRATIHAAAPATEQIVYAIPGDALACVGAGILSRSALTALWLWCSGRLSCLTRFKFKCFTRTHRRGLLNSLSSRVGLSCRSGGRGLDLERCARFSSTSGLGRCHAGGSLDLQG